MALPKPTERERAQWYSQRYVAHLPAAGEVVLFDRSWYNRAGVEPVMGGSLGRERFSSWLLSGFAALALVLGAVGVYGVMSYVVSRRTREIGTRVALGASAGTVGRDVMVGGMAPVLIGVVVGLGAALLATRLLASMLFGVEPNNPAIYAAVGPRCCLPPCLPVSSRPGERRVSIQSLRYAPTDRL